MMMTSAGILDGGAQKRNKSSPRQQEREEWKESLKQPSKREINLTNQKPITGGNFR